MDNPLLEFDSLPPFDRIEPAHARPALEKVLADNRARLAELTAQPQPTFASLVAPFEELSHRLSRVWSPIGHLNAVANTAAMREAYNECVPLLTAYASELGQNEDLYRAYSRVLQQEGSALDPEQRKLVENALRDFRLAGVALPPDRKSRYRDLMQRLAQLGTKFTENVLDAQAAYTRSVADPSELAGLPPSAIDRAAADARDAGGTGWLFKLDQPTYVTVLANAQSERLRRDIYEAWVTRASDLGPSAGRFDNGPIIAEILPLRHELANLLGFANYADYALATRMARSANQVLSFLQDLARRCLPAGRREFHDLEEFAGRKLNAWDVAFYGDRLQESRFKVSQEALRPYFPLPKVLSGLFAVTQRLYGITARERSPKVGVWHPSVKYYDLLDSNGTAVAGFYLDPYARSDKRSGAWMDECVVAKSLPSGKALPIAQLVCNFGAPVGSAPSLLTHDEVTTLFHEFGHGLHHMLTRVDDMGVSEHLGDQRRGMGCGRVAQPVHGELRVAERGPAAHFRARGHRRAAARRHAAAAAGNADLQRGPRHAAPDRAGHFRLRVARQFRSGGGRARDGNPGGRAQPGRGGAGGALQPIAVELRSYLRRGLRRRLLQLQMGRGARGRRLRSLRGGRRIRRLDRGPFPRLDPGARRQRGCDGRLRAFSRSRTRCARSPQAHRDRRVNTPAPLGILHKP